MKPADKKWSTYIDFGPENYDTQNWLWLKKTKSNFSLTYIIEDLNGEEVVGTFYEKEL